MKMLAAAFSVIFGLLAGSAGLVGAAFTLRVLFRLLLQGPSAAEDAFVRGASLARWWGVTLPAADRPLAGERSGFAARRNSELGDVLVEEHASDPVYAR
jgi:hypothetical protein